MGIQAGLGGTSNGFVMKFAGRSFWEGFATGAIGGALGGGAGFAFAGARAGFLATVAFDSIAEGAIEAGTTYYSTGDFKQALANGRYAVGSGIATAGIFSAGG